MTTTTNDRSEYLAALDGMYDCACCWVQDDTDPNHEPQWQQALMLAKAAPAMEKSLAHILVLIQQGVDDQDITAIEDHCRAALAEAWGVQAEEVWTPDLAEFGIANPKATH